MKIIFIVYYSAFKPMRSIRKDVKNWNFQTCLIQELNEVVLFGRNLFFHMCYITNEI